MSTDKCVLNKRQIYSPLGLTCLGEVSRKIWLHDFAINNNGGSVPVIFISLVGYAQRNGDAERAPRIAIK